MTSQTKMDKLLFHYFTKPLPYYQTWLVQEQIHHLQLRLRRSASHSDVLLLLQHRPTYTAGRRQTEPLINHERKRLAGIGADFVSTTRGGQLTYHGPGQIVGYPLMDLSRYSPTMGARDYVCRLQKTLQSYLNITHGISPSPSEHTGVFLDPTTKVASIGVQIRHRLTSHGFAINITPDPLPWFNQIVACGLDNVHAGAVQTAVNRPIDCGEEVPKLIVAFSQQFQRDMLRVNLDQEGELEQILRGLEETSNTGEWPASPILNI